MWSNLQTWAAGGDTSGAYKKAAVANMAAQQQLQAAKNIKNKSAEETMQEGQTAAGVAAANKAGEAAKNAKAAAVMGNAGRLQAATAGANAAADAASQGFTETANASQALAAQQDAAEKQRQVDLAKAQANLTAAQGQQQIAQAEGEADRRAGMRQATLGAVGSIFSDASCKKFKHTYIKPEDRRQK